MSFLLDPYHDCGGAGYRDFALLISLAIASLCREADGHISIKGQEWHSLGEPHLIIR